MSQNFLFPRRDQPLLLPVGMPEWLPSVLVFLGVLVIGLAGRLRAGWQRRQALIAVIEHARGSTVIVRRRGRCDTGWRLRPRR